MKFKSLLTHFFILFIPLFIVSVLLTFVYNAQVRDRMDINLEIALLMAIVLDVIVTWVQNRGKNKNV